MPFGSDRSSAGAFIRLMRRPADCVVLEAFLSPDDYARLLKILPAVTEDDAFVLVAEWNARIVGWAVVHTRFRDDAGWVKDENTVAFQTGENAYLEHLSVEETLRSRGIGRALLAEAEAEAIRRGKTVFWLHTGETNVHARNFYVREGWQHHETAHPVWQDHRPMCIYRKTLGHLLCDAAGLSNAGTSLAAGEK